MAGRKFQASIQAGKLFVEAGTVPGSREASVSFETRWTGKGYIEGGCFYEQVEAVPNTADWLSCWSLKPLSRERYNEFMSEASPEAFKAEYLCSPYNEQDIRATNAMYGTITGRMSCKTPNESNRPKSFSEELAKKVDRDIFYVKGSPFTRAVDTGRDVRDYTCGLDYAKLEASLMSTLAKMKDRPPVDPYSIHAERMVNGWEFKGGYPKLTIGDRRQIIQAFNRTFLSTGDREFARSLSRKEYRRIMFAKARQIVKQVFFTEAYGGRSKIGGISSPNAQRVAPDFFQERRF